ncbi:PPK2 family polyphosphate:nucleotide phosphotransferase [Deinococcus sp. HSC-46F16]|uniref:polyphosphate kinase 2 family protein n=1 Tax=Deinococcus sp. HSC-46F16 TaxID=2910968 RepID=UPI0020A19227|nr:polyphosphate kinase 2 family protein [Deinococcus sp. HSC-46F16]MCP2015969.1 PPK2 family polyphosphate:nucleotide phosphotransferase [Deinococcus sp. HSC-46F16]
MDMERYRVPPQQRAHLDDWNPRDKAGLSKEEGSARLEHLLNDLADLQERLYAEGQQALLIVLQARDAGGKDGTVKKVIGAFNPSGVHIANFKVPTSEEQAHDFLWRVHARVPPLGMIGVFNRSHYEDVLVPRAQGRLDAAATARRLEHIRAFEALLTDARVRVVKFYLHISPEEQRERLQARLDDPTKYWKFNPADLKAREAWEDYTQAYQDVLATSTPEAPWYVIPADHKWFRNLLIAEVLRQTLRNMNPQYPPPTFDPATVQIP